MNFWRDRDINCREYMVQVASEADEAGQVTGYSKEGYQAPNWINVLEVNADGAKYLCPIKFAEQTLSHSQPFHDPRIIPVSAVTHVTGK